MNRSAFFSIIILPFLGCSNNEHRYVNSTHTRQENIWLSPDTSIAQWSLAVNTIDTSLEVIISLKLIDTQTVARLNVDSIHFKLNNLSSDVAKKRVVFNDTPQAMSYRKLADIPNLANRIKTGTLIEFIYIFSSKKLVSKRRILFQFDIDGPPKPIKKSLSMTKRAVYRSWFLVH